MENKRPFAPEFVSKADHTLLISQPVTWSTRIHLVAWYGSAITLLIAVMSFIAGSGHGNYHEEGNWTVLLGLMSFLAIVIWLVFLLRFNVFKRFGHWKNYDTLKTYLLYFLTLGLFISWPFIPTVVKTIRANLYYSSNELSRDINAINYKVCQLEKDALDNTFGTDTLQVNDSVENEERVAYLTADSLTAYRENYTLVNTDLLVQKLAEADSSLRLNDSVYVIYQYPNYVFVNNFDVWKNADDTQYYSRELFWNVIKNRQPFDREKVRKELITLLKKYMTADDISYYGEPGAENQQTLDVSPGPLDKYHLQVVESNIDSITGSKYRFDDGGYRYIIRTMYYICLVISLLIVLFRHVSARTFFLWLLSGFVLAIFTVLAISGSGDETVLFGFILFYFFLFLLIGLSVFSTGTQSMVAGISICFAVFLTPFVPLLFTAVYYTSLSYQERLTATTNESLHYQVAEIAGFVILLLLLLTGYRKMFKKWYASPQE